MNPEPFQRDLERFQASILQELNEGLDDMKKIVLAKDYKLRIDLQNSIGGFMAYMKDRYMNGKVGK